MRYLAPVTFAFILGLLAQALGDLPYRPRFGSPTANYWAVAAMAVLVPVLVVVMARMVPRTWLRRGGYIAAAVLALPCLLVSSCAITEAPGLSHEDAAYELLSEARAGRVAYRLYRTNCGATCAYGLDLREELDLPFGAKLVSPRWSLYRASEGIVKLEPSAVLVVRGDDVLAKVAR